MKIETSENKKGTLITVETGQKIALAVYSNGEERIYLPGRGGQDSTYYTEDPDYLTSTDSGYRVSHPEEPEEIRVIS